MRYSPVHDTRILYYLFYVSCYRHRGQYSTLVTSAIFLFWSVFFFFYILYGYTRVRDELTVTRRVHRKTLLAQTCDSPLFFFNFFYFGAQNNTRDTTRERRERRPVASKIRNKPSDHEHTPRARAYVSRLRDFWPNSKCVKKKKKASRSDDYASSGSLVFKVQLLYRLAWRFILHSSSMTIRR